MAARNLSDFSNKTVGVTLGYNKGGGGGSIDPMEARVKRLEDDMKEIKGDLKSLLKDSAEIKGKISNMPSTWQIVGIVGVMLGLVIASGGGILGLIRYLQP
ncbi:hypothetical protein [Agrobacterium fabrum]|uniref:hypothetical protein n=1 Tax=Agrobacterium fabrum TaxID=1176649 RepID=UPI002157FE32|nr:hypothetical protein [Agrobacterium fabrum]MCR6725997.1 hypothetical protein [Agrobacterium fabrum]